MLVVTRAANERGGKAEIVHGEHLIQALQETCGRVAVLGFEPGGVRGEPVLALLDRTRLKRRAQSQSELLATNPSGEENCDELCVKRCNPLASHMGSRARNATSQFSGSAFPQNANRSTPPATKGTHGEKRRSPSSRAECVGIVSSPRRRHTSTSTARMPRTPH
jgi:hypothetical protein